MNGNPEPSKTRILVVDDDRLICWALVKDISSYNLSSNAVETGAEALWELRRHPYDLVFLDIHLPDSDGIDLLREIRTIRPGTRVVVMSCDDNEANRQRAFAGGASQFLEKPFDLSDVHDILRSTASGHPQTRRNTRYICRLPARISLPESAPEESVRDLRNLIGVVIDIHPEGFRLLTEFPLRAGQRIHVRISVGNDPFLHQVPSEAAALVVWTAPARGAFTAGLRFLP